MDSDVKTRLIKLYLQKRPKLLRFLLVRFRDDTIAEDVLQNVYIKLKKASFDQPIHNDEGFLVRLTNNAALDYLKQSARRKSRDHTWSELRTQSIGGEPIHDQPEADRVVDGRKKVTRLAGLIQQLPPKCREVFIAHKLRGVSYSDIAQNMGISRSMVEKHMTKALRFLAYNMRDGD